MENDEEFFIIRFTGPQIHRDAIFDYLTGKSIDFANYSRFFDAMDVKRVQSLKDFFSAMSSVAGSVPAPAKSKISKPTAKPKLKAAKIQREPILNTPSTSSGHQNQIPTVKALKSTPKLPLIEEKPSSLLLNPPSTSSGPQMSNKNLKPPHKSLKRQTIPKPDEFLKIPKIEDQLLEPKKEIETEMIAPQWPGRDRVITSQTLKLHNISFEKKKT